MKKLITFLAALLLAGCNSAPKVQTEMLPPAKPICQESNDDVREVGFQLAVRHYFGETESLIKNVEQRDRLVKTMESFVLSDPCLPKLFNPSSKEIVDIYAKERPEGSIIIDTIRGGVSAYTTSPITISNFKLWREQTNKRLNQAFSGKMINANVWIDR